MMSQRIDGFGVVGPRKKSSFIPNVFAYRKSDVFSFDLKNGYFISRFKISLLFKNVIVGKKPFAIIFDEFPILEYCR